MALTSNFNTLLKEYNPNDLLTNEISKLNWVLKKCKKDSKWGYGNYNIPVELSEQSRFEWGALPADTDIPLATYGKPYVSTPAQLLGSMLFDQVDLERHDGDMKKSFLSILPQKQMQFVERMTEQMNLQILGDGSLATLTADATVGGLVTVGKAKASLFTSGQKVTIDSSTEAAVSGYVRNIDIAAGTFYLYDAASGGAVIDLSVFDTADSAKIYAVGAQAGRCTSLVDICFSAANGGADTLYGGTLVKAASPVLQPYTNDISSANTGANFLSALYDVLFEKEEMGRGSKNSEVIMPFHAFKAAAKAAEGYRKYEMGKSEVTYGSSSVQITGPNGMLTLRGARGVPSNKAMIVDWDSVVIASRGEMVKNANQMTEEFFTKRATTGYQFILDKKAEFELVATKMQNHGGLVIASSIA